MFSSSFGNNFSGTPRLYDGINPPVAGVNRLRPRVTLMTIHKVSRTLLLRMLALALALVVGSCAPLQPTNPTGPRGNEPVYPVLLVEDNIRKETAQAAVNRLKQSVAPPGNSDTIEPNPTEPNPSEFNLSPVTATIQSLPSSAGSSLYLPKVGVAAVMNEEETRESLRRFIRDWRELIGSDPAKLSLVDHLVQPDASNLANYEQRPFRFPIRGNYGKLHIRFTTDRRVLSLSSTCIPDADRVQTALGAISVKLKAEDAVKQLRENDIPYSDLKAAKLTFRVPAGAQLNPQELVTYIQPSKSRANALEFHIAWEIELSNAPVKLVYVDAITGEIIAAE